MTLFELRTGCAIYLFTGLGAYVGFAVGGRTGGLVGWFAGPALLLGLMVAADFVESHFSGRPYWPACRSCGSQRFETRCELGQYVVHCECGERYVRRGRECLRVTPGGSTRPYLRWRPFRGWYDERSVDAPHTAAPYREEPTPQEARLADP